MSTPAELTIPRLFHSTVARAGDQPAVGIILDGLLNWKTWNEIAADVATVMVALTDAGVGFQDRVVQIAPNSYGWIVTDLAILSLGAVHVPLHASLPTAQLFEQVQLADAELLIVPDESSRLACDLKTLSHEELNLSAPSRQFEVRKPQFSDLATILFTSGTTGHPRGVMLSHANLATNAIATTEAVASPHDETRLCILPLSHIYARTCDLYTWIYRGSRLVLAESRDTIMRDCQIVRPTVVNGVPYFYQKVAQSLHAAGKLRQTSALQNLLGGEVRQLFCGGAAIAPQVEVQFAEQGLPLLSGYGLTEASPVISATRKEHYKPGIVGRLLRDVEVRLEHGEILARGPNVMLGYWRDEYSTREAIIDGWLHTGDLGEFDSENNLRIVGRRKELLVLTTGKKVCPSTVEQRLAGSPFVEAVCVVGDGQSHLAALIVPNPQALRNFIRENRLWVWSKHRAVSHPRVQELYRNEINRVLADLAHEEQVGPFALLTRNFSLEHGEITAKFSLRREAILEAFADEIRAMYGSR